MLPDKMQRSACVFHVNYMDVLQVCQLKPGGSDTLGQRAHLSHRSWCLNTIPHKKKPLSFENSGYLRLGEGRKRRV